MRAGLRGLVRRRNPDPLCFRIGLGDCTIRGGDLRGSNRLSADSLDSKRLCSSCRYASACLVATFWYVIPAERTADPSGNRSHGGGSDIVRMGGPPAREDCRAFAVVIARHYWLMIGFAVFSGILAALLNIALAYGGDIIQRARDQGAKPVWAVYAVWSLVLAGALIVNVGYSFYLLSRNKTWRNFGTDIAELRNPVLGGC